MGLDFCRHEFQVEVAIISNKQLGQLFIFISVIVHFIVYKLTKAFWSFAFRKNVVSKEWYKVERKYTLTTPEKIRKVKTRIDWNSLSSGTKIARQLNISRKQTQLLLKFNSQKKTCSKFGLFFEQKKTKNFFFRNAKIQFEIFQQFCEKINFWISWKFQIELIT